MAHFVEQYTHAIQNSEDYDMLTHQIEIGISKNILNHVSTDIKDAIDRLNVDTPFYNFIKMMVWASTVSDHTETSLNLLRYFCNKVVSQFDSLSFELDEYSLMVVAICADDKSFLNRITDDRKVELANTLCRWYLVKTGEDNETHIADGLFHQSFDLILQGYTIDQLDRYFENKYKDICNENENYGNHVVNELVRPFQALFINIIQNIDQEELLFQLSTEEWINRVDSIITEKSSIYAAKGSSKDPNEYKMILHDLIFLFEEFNKDFSTMSYNGFDNPVVGKFLWFFLESLHQQYNRDNVTLDEIKFLVREAERIFCENFAVNEQCRVILCAIIDNYCGSPSHEDSLMQGQYLDAIKMYLKQDSMFMTWYGDYKDNNKDAPFDRVLATYINDYMNPMLELADTMIPLEDSDILNESALAYIKEVANILNENYDNTEDDMAIEAAGYSDTNRYPIFILLTLGHTSLSKIITTFTGDSYSHSSLSFDISLDPLYSFGTKKIDPSGREMGFIITNPYSNLWGDIPVKYDLFVTYVDKVSLEKMKKRLKYFTDNHETLKYDFAGLVRIFLNIKSKTEAKWFCSRFVAEIINSGKNISKDPSLYRPQTLRDIQDVEFVISGKSIKEYNVPAARKALEAVKRRPDNMKPVLEAKSERLDPDEDENEDSVEDNDQSYDGPEIDARQSNKGYHKSSKIQATADRKIYGAYKKYKNNEAKVDSQLAKMLTSAKKAFSQDKTEEIIEGKRFTPIGLLKKILTTAAIFNFSKIAGFVYLLTSHTLSEKRTQKQKNEILIEIDTEIRMLDEKIEDARGDGNRQAKYALMRTRTELIRARDKIKYNLTATKDDIKTAKAYLSRKDRDYS